MKECTEMYLEEYYNYRNFIDECLQKKYDKSLITHLHHIIPKNHGGSNKTENFVRLSVEDHISAHILFAKCFPIETFPYNSNMRSARFLKNKSIVFADQMCSLISECYSGENNPFYGKTHSTESIEKMLKTKIENGTTFRGVSYENRYGDKAPEEKLKRANSVKNDWAEMSEVDKNNRKENIRRGVMLSDPEERKKRARNAALANKPHLIIDGKTFECMRDAMKYFGMTEHFIRKNFTIEKKVKD